MITCNVLSRILTQTDKESTHDVLRLEKLRHQHHSLVTHHLAPDRNRAINFTAHYSRDENIQMQRY